MFQKNRKLLFIVLATIAILPFLGIAKQVAAQGSNILHLPIVTAGVHISRAPTIFGGELLLRNVVAAAPKAAAAGVTWSRFNRYQWGRVETYPGERNWANQADQERQLAAMSAAGLTPIMIIHNTPAWAQQAEGSFCGPIKRENFDEFANFMYDAVQRFSKPPYNVKYFEIYNEPDIPPTDVDRYSIFGCWGDATDSEWYGGDYYGEMLNVVYPKMKEANPDVQVMIGGLLLICDYNRVYPDGRDCSPSKFLKGVLSTGADSFDMVSYHGYPLRSHLRFDWERDYPLWNHRGGVVLGKLDFINEQFDLMQKPRKPVVLTEAGLLCWRDNGCDAVQDALQQDQANYAVRLYTRAQANGLAGALWYTFDGPGWRDAGILDSNQNPRPAYLTFQFLSTLLPGSSLAGQTLTGNLEGYIYERSNTQYQFWWTNDENGNQVAFPAGGRLYNKFGQELPAPSDGVLIVGFEPLIVVAPK